MCLRNLNRQSRCCGNGTQHFDTDRQTFLYHFKTGTTGYKHKPSGLPAFAYQPISLSSATCLPTSSRIASNSLAEKRMPLRGLHRFVVPTVALVQVVASNHRIPVDYGLQAVIFCKNLQLWLTCSNCSTPQIPQPVLPVIERRFLSAPQIGE
ncbi:Uncharacterised protein [Actinobacillus equuli]|nr:Uncharacterised protein [Actinobacillus equuli]